MLSGMYWGASRIHYMELKGPATREPSQPANLGIRNPLHGVERELKPPRIPLGLLANPLHGVESFKPSIPLLHLPTNP